MTAKFGLIVNMEELDLPEDSPVRTRDEERDQEPVFVLGDGYPVWEVWLARMGRWWCYSHAPNPELEAQGAIYFSNIEELKAKVAWLQQQTSAA